MKKQLLLVLVAAMSALTSFAYNDGEYVYTRDGRYKVQGQNLLTNGDFSQGLQDWVSASGWDRVANEQDTLIVDPTGGPGGIPCLNVQIGKQGNVQNANWNFDIPTTCATTNFWRIVPVEASATYVITYKAKAATDGVWAVNIPSKGRNNNFHQVYFNMDGSCNAYGTTKNYVSTEDAGHTINKNVEVFGTEWKEFSYAYTVPADGNGYIGFLFAALAANQQYADFGIYKVAQVSDDRIVKDMKEQVNFYIEQKDVFPNAQDLLSEQILPLLDDLERQETKASVDEFARAFNSNTDDDPVKEFLDQNSVDVTNYFKNFYVGGTGWTATGGGWAANQTATSNFTTNYVKQNARASASKGEGTYEQTVDLPGGKYLFIVEAQAMQYTQDGSGGSSNYWIANYTPFEGMKAYINNDTINMDDVTSDRAKYYYALLDLEDGPKTVGFYSPQRNGAESRFDAIQLRLMGKTQDDVDAYFWQSQVMEKRANFQAGIDAAETVYNSDDYLFEKTLFGEQIAWAKQQMVELTDYTEDNFNALTQAHDSIDKARRAYVKVNVEYTLLKGDIAKCKETIADETRPLEKPAFQAVIDEADNYFKAQTETSRDSLQLMTLDTKLMKARETYLVANATYATPADLAVVNNSFQMTNDTGWTQDGATGNNRWKFQARETHDEGYAVHYDRGSGANDSKYIWQEIEVSKTGVYQFEATVACHLSTKAAGDTNYDTGARLYIGADSIIAVTDSKGLGGQNTGEVKKMTVRTILTEIPEGGKLRFGLDRKDIGAVCNIMEVGSCHVYYAGPYDKYLADSTAIALAPTKAELQEKVDEAKALRDEVRNPNNVDTTPFNNAINAAQATIDNANVTLDEVNAQFPALEAATTAFMFSGVFPAEGKSFDHNSIFKNLDFATIDAQELAFWEVDSLKTGDDDNLVVNIHGNENFPGYLWSFHNQGDKYPYKRSADVRQKGSGLVKGFYTYSVNAVYRHGWKEGWSNNEETNSPAEYETENTWAYVFANADTVAIDGLGTGAHFKGAKTLSDKGLVTNDLEYDNGESISYYSARHQNDANGIPAFIKLFESGLFEKVIEIENAEAGSDLTIGFYINGIPLASGTSFYKPTLRFWGDKAGYEAYKNAIDAIEAVSTVAEKMNNSAIYNLNGQRVNGAMKAGLYIQNGKKFFVK